MLVGSSSDTYQLSHPFRQPLHFMVMTIITVMVREKPIDMGILSMTGIIITIIT